MADGEAKDGRGFGRIDPARIREHMVDVNDGILATAGFAEGLLGAGLASTQVYAIIAISAVAGAVGVAGAKFGEESSNREAELQLVAEERRLLDLSPEEERAELIEHYRAKGLSLDTAQRVADELTLADALSAQLETEYGIRELTTRWDPWVAALWSGLGFLLGAAVPVLVSLLIPGAWMDEFILLAVVVSLAVTGFVLSRLGHTRVAATLVRSVLIGLASLGASYLLGSWIG
ncbi:MAG: VIT1/CCC1 transporter family protein [Propionicimonas sp.]|uniref:VIT1/CCC1 transporter family protein n=1 Tax=Propionicimonas sp. TaxID=1955623 RepID=UPI003D0CB35F